MTKGEAMYHRQFFRNWGPDRMFQKGDFKYLILDLLKSKPRHGYEIIRELEKKFHGFYSPSPGMVYPTLQYLEEMGYVTGREQDGKKVYTITEAGLKFLEEQAGTVDDIKDYMKSHWWSWTSELGEQFRDVMLEYGEMGRLLGRRVRGMNKEKLKAIGDVLKKAYSDIERIIREEPPSHV
jgi:DNA-binding PadR family transcriptional regulator